MACKLLAVACGYLFPDRNGIGPMHRELGVLRHKDHHEVSLNKIFDKNLWISVTDLLNIF